MNSRKEQICRICLKVAKDGLQKIDYTMKQLFDILLIKLDWDLTRDPIICQDCLDVAKSCLNFKSLFIDTEEIILSFSAGERKSEQSIKFIYAAKKQAAIANDEGLDICRFCMFRLERTNFVPLDTLLNRTMFEMMTKYMPEMEINVPEDPIICTTCRENLEDYSQFILNCLGTEANIKAYCKDKSNNKEVVHLDNVLHFMSKDIVEYPIEYQIYKIKQESNKTENTDVSNAYIGIIKQEEVDIKDEEFKLNERSCKNSSEIIINKYNDLFPSKIHKSDMFSLKARRHNNEGHTFQQMVQGNIVENSSIYGDKLEEKWNESSDTQKEYHVVNGGKTGQRESTGGNLMVTNETPDIDTYNYAEAVSVSKYKGDDNENSGSETSLYQRPLYDYETKRNDCLKTHITLVHKDIAEIKRFKCALCTYKAKYKTRLNRHMLVHKDTSEIKMFRCALCVYQAKRKFNLTAHMSVHKDVSEIKMFTCALCTYETNDKSSLNRHMLVHRDVSEIKMFKCALCVYKAKRKGYLEQHMLVHRDISEINIFRCTLCIYEAKTKDYLKRHMLVHKDVPETKMLKCSLCAYKSIRKGNLKEHTLIHKDISEIKMFKCALCAYEGKSKRYLTSHMLVHKTVSEIKMFKCALCVYEAKTKRYLQRHNMLLHKYIPETKMFKCSLCAYKGTQKKNLKEHMLIHKDVSEIKMFNCALCAYKAKTKNRLDRHMLIHKDVSEIKMFKCELCAYETKRKSNRDRHMLVHKDVPDTKVNVS